jgi:predicted O-methyltransferase YrrM
MPDILKEFNLVKGFLDHEEGVLLYKMAKKYCIQGFAVEIGSYCGKSACYIGQACKENKTHLVTIDHHRGSEEQQFGEEYFDPEEYDYKNNRVDTHPTLLRNITKYELGDHVKSVVDDSESASKKIKSEIDFLFIDGSHTFASARSDYESWKDKIRTGGILTIHDIYDSELEGGQAPREIFEQAMSEDFRLVERVNSLVALEKIR